MVRTFSTTGSRRRPSVPGFTVLELMVVIGILVILIGILLPAIRGVQRAAKNTTTTNLINTIGTAIDQYQVVTRDWPGPYANDADRSSDDFTKIQGKPLIVGPENNVTRSEELLMCLAGGMNVGWQTTSGGFTVVAADYKYNPEDLDRGHVSLSPKNRGRLKAFMTGSGSRSNTKATAKQFERDTLIPEFVDSYGSPILYVRALKGVGTIVKDGTLRRTAFYDYTDTDTVISGGALRLEAQRYVDDAFILFPPSYCTNPSLPEQTVQQDRYILISAGPDKKYGTADDITNFGTPVLK